MKSGGRGIVCGVSTIQVLDQRMANFFYQRPDTKYLRLCRAYGHLLIAAIVVAKAAIDSMKMKTNESNCVPIKLHLKK